MLVWDQLVDVLRAGIVAYAQACGGNVGYGVVAVTLLLRMAMLPLSLRLARASAAHQDAMRRLKPELDKIRERFKTKPRRMVEETQQLFRRNGVSPTPLRIYLGLAFQMPILLALYSAVRDCVAAGGRFLWIRNIGRPDFLLTVAVTAITCATVALGSRSPDHGKLLLIAVPTITFLVLLKMSAGVSLYWGASGLVNVLQSAIVRRRAVNGTA